MWKRSGHANCRFGVRVTVKRNHKEHIKQSQNKEIIHQKANDLSKFLSKLNYGGSTNI